MVSSSSSSSHRGPNPFTVADGYSLTDERQPIAGPNHDDFDDRDDDFNYDHDNDTTDYTNVSTGLDSHLPHPDMPKLLLSHPGEHRGDYGDRTVEKIGRKVAIFAMIAALNSTSFGYDIGVSMSSGALIQNDLDLSDKEVEILLGSVNLFSMLGALMSWKVLDDYGRRMSFVVTSGLLLIGVGITVAGSSFGMLLAGRAFVGIGVGFGLAVDPIYIAEIAPASHRGELVTWSEIGVNVGMILGFAAGLGLQQFYGDDSSWRYMIGFGGVLPCLVVLLVFLVLPESPRWLVSKKRTRQAKSILRQMYPADFQVEPVILDIRESIEREIIAEREIGWNIVLFPTPAIQRMLLVGVGVAIAQQAVGLEAIQYFLLYIIDEAGIDTSETQTGAMIFLGLLKIVFLVVGGKLFDRKGRRTVLFVSLSGITIALLMLSIDFYGANNFSAGFAIFALSLYLAFFSLGLGPGAWLIPAEGFGSCIRAKAMSVATFFNRVTAVLVSSTFLSTARTMSWSAYFFLLSVVCVVYCLFFYAKLPETEGRSLEAMSVYFAEITGDRSILEAERQIVRDRRAREHAAATGPSFEPPTAREQPPEILQDATVVGTMS